MPAGDYIRAARIAAGLTQRELAERLGVTQPAISALESGREDATVSRVEQALAAMHQRFIVVPFRATSAADAAHQIRSDLIAQRPDHALREIVQLADDMNSDDNARRFALAMQTPASTGDRGFDALIAGTVQLRLDDRGLPHPQWLSDPHSFLPEPWDLEPLPELQDDGRAHTPPALAARNVYIHRSFFASV